MRGFLSLHWAVGDHFDFYDRLETIRASADVIAEHFRTHLV